MAWAISILYKLHLQLKLWIFFVVVVVVFFKIIISSNTLFHMNISTSGGQWENHQVIKQHKILSSGTPGSSSFPAPSPPLPAPLGRIIHSKGGLALGGTDTISLEGSASSQINLELSWDFLCLSNYPSHFKVRKPNLWDPETQTPAARVTEESHLMPHTVTIFLLAHEPLSSPSVK